MNAPGLSLADRFWIAHRWAAFGLGTVFLVGVIVAGIAGRIRPHYAWAYALMSNLAFLAYGLDKSAAVADRWRWSEKALHWIELLCGWPGALIGQHAFRHKSRKASFLFFTWLASAANAAVFAHLAGFYRWSWQWGLLVFSAISDGTQS